MPSQETFRLCRIARAKFDAGEYSAITPDELDAMSEVEEHEMGQRLRAAAREGTL